MRRGSSHIQNNFKFYKNFFLEFSKLGFQMKTWITLMNRAVIVFLFVSLCLDFLFRLLHFLCVYFFASSICLLKPLLFICHFAIGLVMYVDRIQKSQMTLFAVLPFVQLCMLTKSRKARCHDQTK